MEIVRKREDVRRSLVLLECVTVGEMAGPGTDRYYSSVNGGMMMRARVVAWNNEPCGTKVVRCSRLYEPRDRRPLGHFCVRRASKVKETHDRDESLGPVSRFPD